MGFGLLEYDRATGKIVNQYQHDPSANSLSSKAISSVLEDSFGEFRIATANMELNRLDKETCEQIARQAREGTLFLHSLRLDKTIMSPIAGRISS